MGKHPHPFRVLILGGTTEARGLAEKLAKRHDIVATISLAGRTSDPKPLPLSTRIGGFGGVDGLIDYLAKESIEMLIDATHPFASRISENAAKAAASVGVPLFALCRLPWQAVGGDRWISVDSVEAAVSALGTAPRRVFLAIGRQDAGRFSAAPQHIYLVRSVDPVKPPLDVPHCQYVLARAPFHVADERKLLEQNLIDVIVTKNSGGSATYPKIAAARERHLPVVMIERRRPSGVVAVASVEDAVALIDQRLPPAWKRGV